MSESLPEFIVLQSSQTLNRIIDINAKYMISKGDKGILLTFIDRFKHYVRNCDTYSKDLIEEFLKIMFKLSSLLDYDGLGTIFPFLSVTAVKALIYVLPGVNGMIQTYLTRIWQFSCLKVIGDNSFYVQKYFTKELEEDYDNSKMTIEEFINSQKEEKAKEEAKSMELDKPWIKEWALKVQEWLNNIDKNFYKLVEKNNLKTFCAISDFVDNLLSYWSNIFLITGNYEIFLTANAIYNYWRVYTKESPEGNEVRFRVNLRSIFSPNDIFIKHKGKILELVETSIEAQLRLLSKNK